MCGAGCSSTPTNSTSSVWPMRCHPSSTARVPSARIGHDRHPNGDAAGFLGGLRRTGRGGKDHGRPASRNRPPAPGDLSLHGGQRRVEQSPPPDDAPGPIDPPPQRSRRAGTQGPRSGTGRAPVGSAPVAGCGPAAQPCRRGELPAGDRVP